MVHPVIRVNSVNRVPDARRRTGFVAALETRWRETVERIRTELPPDHPMQAAGNGMRSELALDDLQDQLEAALAARAAAPPDPLVTAAAREFYELLRQYNACAVEIRDAQPWLRRAAGDWKHQVLGDLLADMASVPVPQPTSIDERRTFFNVPDARRAATDFLPKLQWAKGVCEQIKYARSFDNDPREQQCIALVQALWARLLESQNRLITLESANAALEARLNQLERGRRKKAKAPTIKTVAA